MLDSCTLLWKRAFTITSLRYFAIVLAAHFQLIADAPVEHLAEPAGRYILCGLPSKRTA